MVRMLGGLPHAVVSLRAYSARDAGGDMEYDAAIMKRIGT